MFSQTDDSNDYARLSVPQLTTDDTIENINICVEWNEKNLDGIFLIYRRNNTASSWSVVGYRPGNE